MDPVILRHWLHHEPVRQYLVKGANESVRASINHKLLQKLDCPLIEDSAERREIARRLHVLDEAVSAAAQNLADLKPARSGFPTPRSGRGSGKRSRQAL